MSAHLTTWIVRGDTTHPKPSIIGSQRFKLTSQTLALRKRDGEWSAVQIPANETISLGRTPSAGQRFVSIEWNGEAFEVFTQDFLDRGVRIKE